jgi:hypothetical protein
MNNMHEELANNLRRGGCCVLKLVGSVWHWERAMGFGADRPLND